MLTQLKNFNDLVRRGKNIARHGFIVTIQGDPDGMVRLTIRKVGVK